MSVAASDVFAILQPRNVAARLAFNSSVERSRCQPSPSWLQFMHIDPVKVYDAEYARQCEMKAISYDVDSEASFTEPETDVEEQQREKYSLWTGHFIFKLVDIEQDFYRKGGKGRLNCEDGGVHFMLASGSVRGVHIKFFLDEIGFIALTPATRVACDITVDGDPIEGRSHHLNKATVDIGIVDLCYRFSYTDFARSEEFTRLRTQFWASQRNQQLMEAHVAQLSLTPIPPKDHLSIGRYVLSTEIGRGAYGKVYSATDQNGAVFAIKVVERNKKSASSVARELKVLQDLTREAKEADCINIIQLVEVIGDCQSNTDNLLFKDIYIVFGTAAYCTLKEVVKTNSNVPLQARLRYLHDILMGLKFMHDRSWVHRDIKENNVGIYQDRAVLLDMGCAVRLRPPSMYIPATPGYGGTIGYLAPETEVENSRYGCGVDIWAAGIVGFALIYHRHPLNLGVNPWRKGNEASLPLFHSFYQDMYDCLSQDSPGAPGTNDLLMKMLRSEKTSCNQGLRITAGEALDHWSWDNSIDVGASPLSKRPK